MASSAEFSAEPGCADYPYAGWIPTVSGRLSFRHVGEAQHPTPSKYANIAGNSRRLILSYQKRPLSDAKFRTITHFLFNRTGDFWFAVACHSDKAAGNESRLIGSIYFYKSKSAWRGHAEVGVRSRVINMQSDGLSINDEQRAYADTHYQEAKQHLDETADVQANFVLVRNGDIFISNPIIKDKMLECNSIENAQKWGRNFLKDVVDQFYFFMRDITHKHQHHPAEDDTILILQERNSDKILWRKRILFSLYYYIIGSKRAVGPISQIEALGVLSYANSYHKNCCRQFPDNLDEMPIFNDTPLRSSIEARIKEDEAKEEYRQYRESKRLLASGTSRNYTLSVFAIVLALIAILVQPHINGSEKAQFPAVYAASVFVTEHLARVAEAIFVLALFIWLASSPKVLEWALGRDVLEFSNTNRRISTPITIFLAVGVLATTLYFEMSLVTNYAHIVVTIVSSFF